MSRRKQLIVVLGVANAQKQGAKQAERIEALLCDYVSSGMQA